MRIVLVVENADYAEPLLYAANKYAYEVVELVTSISALRAVLTKTEVDILVLALEQVSHRQLRQIKHLYLSHPCPIVLFTRRGDAPIINAALQAGVSALVVDGLAAGRVKSIVDLAVIRFHETQTLQKQLQEANTTPAERKLIQQAVEVLMSKTRIPENAARLALYKMALHRNRRMVDVAGLIVGTAQFSGQLHYPVINPVQRPITPIITASGGQRSPPASPQRVNAPWAPAGET